MYCHQSNNWGTTVNGIGWTNVKQSECVTVKTMRAIYHPSSYYLSHGSTVPCRTMVGWNFYSFECFFFVITLDWCVWNKFLARDNCIVCFYFLLFQKEQSTFKWRADDFGTVPNQLQSNVWHHSFYYTCHCYSRLEATLELAASWYEQYMLFPSARPFITTCFKIIFTRSGRINA